RTARSTAVFTTGRLDSTQDGIELFVADVKCVVMALEGLPIVEVEGQRRVDVDRREVPTDAVVSDAEDLREESGRGLLVSRWDDRVIQDDCHGVPPCMRKESSMWLCLDFSFLVVASEGFSPARTGAFDMLVTGAASVRVPSRRQS